ncbi:MAG: dihydrodipicolinate synthase family protein [Anaerolineales bacterium]|nr:dihydrodipicolinate synthase family protein [Anaerolineales bacterium]
MKSKIQTLKSQVQFGVSPAMATPLLADGVTVNTAVIPQLVQFLIDAGVNGLFVAGTTGEGILLDAAERMRLAEAAMTAINACTEQGRSGRIPLILHIGTNRTDTAVALAQHAAELGVDAIAAVTPYYYGMHDAALVAYYRTISEAAPATPLLLYDIPHMAVNGINPALIPALIQEVPTLAGIKSSLNNAQLIRQQIALLADTHIVLVGNEAIALGSLAMGAHGLISGLSTAVPEPFVALMEAFGTGNLAEAQKWHRVINQLLTKIPAGARIGAIKSILAERGIAVGTAVPPRPMPTKPVWPDMETILTSIS